MYSGKTNTKQSTVIIFLCLFYAAFASLYSEAWNRVALYFALPLAFLLAISQKRLGRPSKYLVVLMIIYLIELISCLWAIDLDVALVHMHRDLGCVLLSIIVYVLAKRLNNIPWIYLVYIFWFVFAWYYAMTHDLILLDVSSESERMNDSKLNANTFAYFTFYTTFAIYVLGEIVHSSFFKKLSRILLFVTIPLSFFVAILTASRQVLLIQIPLISMLLYARYFKKTTIAQRIAFFIAVIVAVFAFSGVVSDTYNSSFLRQRAETNVYEDVRIDLLKDAFNVGMNHFFTGVGAGNYTIVSFNKHFSHNTYIELFACTGIVNALLYIWLVLHFIIQQWKLFRKSKDKMFLGFFIFGIIYAFDNCFYVFHIDCWLISFFILVLTHSETYRKQIANEYTSVS